MKLFRRAWSAFDFVEILSEHHSNNEALLIIDPPYYHKGDQLYPISMSPQEHEILADMLSKTKAKFLLTIDDCDEVRNLEPISKTIG